ncbi:MAG: hypothetical protein M3308_09810 [Actinomycetota bacterium]|nr:hypothetical protein [Actinomycetota bacterium]
MSTPQDPYGPQSQQPGKDPIPGESGYPAAPPPQPSGYPAGMPPPSGGMPPPSGEYTGASHLGDRRPGLVVASVVLWVLIGLFFLLPGLVLALVGDNQAMQEQLEDQLADVAAPSGVQLEPETLQQWIFATGVVMAVLGALLIILSLLMLMRSNVARIVLTVLGVPVALLLLRTVVGTLVVLAAIVLQFLPPANVWFRSRRRVV